MKLDVDVLFAEELDNISMGFPRCDLCYLQHFCIWLCCEYLQHVSVCVVFAVRFYFYSVFLYLFVL